MNLFSRALAPCLVLILFGVGAGSASAQPLSLYQDEAQARLHCVGDAVVWLVWRFRSPHHSCSESEMRTSEPKPHYVNKLLVPFDSEVRK